MARPLSKLCSQGLDPEWITIPLEKFSSSISPIEARTHQWVHDSRRDELFLVFRPERVSYNDGDFKKTTLMTVLAGGDILERQNANSLAAVAEDFKRGVQNGRLDPSIEAPVHVVIKSPCVAVRRIQMKFQNNSDYQKAVDIFRQHQFPVRSAGIKNNVTKSETILRPASTNVTPSPSTFDRYGTSKLPLITAYHTTRTNDSSNTEETRPRQLSSIESRFFVDPPNASSDTVRPSSAWSMSSARRSDTSSSITFGLPLARPGSALEPYRSLCSEKRADLVSVETPYRAFNAESQTAIQSFVNQNLFHEKSKTADIRDKSILSGQKPFKAVNDPANHVDTAPFKRAASACSAPQFSRQDSSTHLDRRMPFLPEHLRPGSAPISESQLHFSQLIPPRRELPFPKLRANNKFHTPTVDATTVAQATFFIDTPSTTKTATDINLKCSSSALTHDAPRVAQRKAMPISTTSHLLPAVQIAEDFIGVEIDSSIRPGEVKNVEELSPLAARSIAIPRSSAVSVLPFKTASTTSRKRANEALVELTPSNKQIKKMVDKGTQTKTLSGRDHTAAHSLTSGTQQPFSTIVGETYLQSQPQNFMNEIDNFVSKHKNRPPPQKIWERPRYAEATPEERQEIINNFICENLDNEDFLKLCEDTAEVWRRIGLEI